MQDAMNKFFKKTANQCRLVFKDMAVVAKVRRFTESDADLSEVIPHLLELRKTQSGALIWMDHCRVAVKIELHRYQCVNTT